jgi:hypothetical protein
MLSKIVRPLVETQIRLLANSKTTQSTLAQTVISWLGYLGVRTEVNQLIPNSDRISISLTVGKPDACNQSDWQKILENLTKSHNNLSSVQSEEVEMAQLIQLSRLLAYVIQVGSPNTEVDPDLIEKQLAPLNLDSVTLRGIRSALKVPQSISAIDKIDPDLAARAFPLAVKIAWMDNQLTDAESEALKALLSLIAPDMKI